MSGIHGIHHAPPQIEQVGTSAPAVPAPVAPQTSAASNPLEAIQNLVKQLETSANTQAIPAHQNW